MKKVEEINFILIAFSQNAVERQTFESLNKFVASKFKKLVLDYQSFRENINVLTRKTNW